MRRSSAVLSIAVAALITLGTSRDAISQSIHPTRGWVWSYGPLWELDTWRRWDQAGVLVRRDVLQRRADRLRREVDAWNNMSTRDQLTYNAVAMFGPQTGSIPSPGRTYMQPTGAYWDFVTAISPKAVARAGAIRAEAYGGSQAPLGSWENPIEASFRGQGVLEGEGRRALPAPGAPDWTVANVESMVAAQSGVRVPGTLGELVGQGAESYCMEFRPSSAAMGPTVILLPKSGGGNAESALRQALHLRYILGPEVRGIGEVDLGGGRRASGILLERLDARTDGRRALVPDPARFASFDRNAAAESIHAVYDRMYEGIRVSRQTDVRLPYNPGDFQGVWVPGPEGQPRFVPIDPDTGRLPWNMSHWQTAEEIRQQVGGRDLSGGYRFGHMMHFNKKFPVVP